MIQATKKSVDMIAFKKMAISFPEPLKTLILAESDRMSASEFIVKFGTWERLAKIHIEDIKR